MAYLFLCVMLNLLSRGGTVSPMYQSSPNIRSGFVVSGTMALFFILFVIVWRRPIFKVLTSRGEPIKIRGKSIPTLDYSHLTTNKMKDYFDCRKVTSGILIYFLLVCLCFFSASGALYHDGDKPEFKTGTEFSFASDYDGSSLKGYRKTYSWTDQPEHVIPVVMLGGTGVNMYTNVEVADIYLYPSYKFNHSLSYEVFTFSYRGYFPNDIGGLTPSEPNIISDSKSFYHFVQDLYPGKHPLLLSHSLGTGPTTFLASTLKGGDEPACVGLGMPLSNMRDVILEVGFYTPLAIIWVIDKWNSVDRITDMSETLPLEILSAGKDELIAPHHQNMVFDAAGSKEKRILFSEDADHNNLNAPIWGNINSHIEFMDLCLARVDGI